MNRFFNEHSIKIGIILSKEVVVDPYVKNKEHTKLNPLPIRAIVSDLTFANIQYKLPGVTTDKAKMLIIKKKRESLLLQSYQIQIGKEFYLGWKRNGKLQYKTEGDFLKVYVYIKKEQ